MSRKRLQQREWDRDFGLSHAIPDAEIQGLVRDVFALIQTRVQDNEAAWWRSTERYAREQHQGEFYDYARGATGLLRFFKALFRGWPQQDLLGAIDQGHPGQMAPSLDPAPPQQPGATSARRRAGLGWRMNGAPVGHRWSDPKVGKPD